MRTSHLVKHRGSIYPLQDDIKKDTTINLDSSPKNNSISFQEKHIPSKTEAFAKPHWVPRKPKERGPTKKDTWTQNRKVSKQYPPVVRFLTLKEQSSTSGTLQKPERERESGRRKE